MAFQTIGHEDDYIHGPFNGLWDGTQDITGRFVSDREYDASTFAAFFAQVVGDGVFPNALRHPMVAGLEGAGLQVMSLHNSMVLTIRAGAAFARGGFFIAPRETQAAVPPAHLTLGRRDIIVVRWDIITRSFLMGYYMGVPSLTPQIPSIERTADGYELQLCVITVNPNDTQIPQEQIQDTRMDNDVCGYVTGLVQSIDTRTLFVQMETWFNQQIEIWEGIRAKQEALWLEQLNNQQEAWYEMHTELTTLIKVLGSEAFSLVNLNFDDWFIRRGCDRVTIRQPDGSIRSEWRVAPSQLVVAHMTTTREANGDIVTAVTFLAWEITQGNLTNTTFPYSVTRRTRREASGAIRSEVR